MDRNGSVEAGCDPDYHTKTPTGADAQTLSPHLLLLEVSSP